MVCVCTNIKQGAFVVTFVVYTDFIVYTVL